MICLLNALKVQAKSIIVYIEGIDGSGKTTHSMELSKFFKKNNLKTIIQRPLIFLLLKKMNLNLFSIKRRKICSDKVISFILKDFLFMLLILLIAWLDKLITILMIKSGGYGIAIYDRYYYHIVYNLIGSKFLQLYTVKALPKPTMGFILIVPCREIVSRLHQLHDRQLPKQYYKNLQYWYLIIAKVMSFYIVNTNKEIKETQKVLRNIIIYAVH